MARSKKKSLAKKTAATNSAPRHQSSVVLLERHDAEEILKYLMTRPMMEVEPAVILLRNVLGRSPEISNGNQQPVPRS